MPLLQGVGWAPLPAGGCVMIIKLACPATEPLLSSRKPPCSPPVNDGLVGSEFSCSASVNCQLPERFRGTCELVLELPPPHADSAIMPVSRTGNTLFRRASPRQRVRASRFFRHRETSFVSVHMILNVS